MSGRIDITFDDGRSHQSVQVAAEFTNWEPVPLGHDTGTRYAAVFDGAEVATLYHYKYIVDGQWSLLPGLETIHDGSGNVNHFVVARQVPKEEKREYSSNKDQPSSADIMGGSAETSSSAPLSSEPYEFVGNTPSSFGTNIPHLDDPVDNVDEPLSKSISGPSSGYDYAEEFNRTPTKSFGENDTFTSRQNRETYGSAGSDRVSSQKPDRSFDYGDPLLQSTGLSTGGGLGGAAGPNISTYGFTEPQLPEPTTTKLPTEGLGHSGPDTTYEYVGSELSEPKDAVDDSAKVATPSKPDTGYEYTESQLLEPEEDILAGQQQHYEPSSGFGYTQSHIPKSKDVLAGGEGYGGSKNVGTDFDTSYEYKESQLPKPQEKVYEAPNTDDEYADAYEDASMPGSLPFERNVLGGQAVPGNDLGDREKRYSDQGYADTSAYKQETFGENSFYDSAVERLDEEGEEEEGEGYRTSGVKAPGDLLDEQSGLPASLSDRTISNRTRGDYYDAESGLDREAAARAVAEASPSTPSSRERVPYEPQTFNTSYSPQHHQPIDVNTGFPVDHPEEYSSPKSQGHRSNGPTLRNREQRHSYRHDRDPAAPPITSQEHRNAAVIAAASKASAFAKQDVAAISGRIETSRDPPRSGQSSPGVSRGPSVRSREQPSRVREAGQYTQSPQQGHNATRTYSSSQQASSPTSAPLKAQQQRPLSEGVHSASSAQTAQPVSAGFATSGAPAGASTGSALNSSAYQQADSTSSASGEAPQLHRSETSAKKEGRLKRFFKLK